MYRGESLATFTMSVLTSSVKSNQDPHLVLTGEIELSKVTNMYAMCGAMLTSDMVTDHIVARAAFANGCVAMLRAIGGPCDRIKTLGDNGEILVKENNPLCIGLRKIQSQFFACRASQSSACVIYMKTPQIVLLLMMVLYRAD